VEVIPDANHFDYADKPEIFKKQIKSMLI